jgi:hypothetical protein
LNANAALWAAVVALGVYHGLNPAMGWPMAVANGLTERRDAAVFRTALPLAGGHFAAMAVVLVPLAGLAWMMAFNRPLRLAAGGVVLAYGVYKLLRPGHPRQLARIWPTQLAWWSFLMASVHGAGLMLVPFMLGLCASSGDVRGDALHAGVMRSLAVSDLATALLVAGVHTLALLAAGVAMAWLVYRYLGLRFLRRAWFDLDNVWAASLVIAGAAGVALAV